MAEKLCQLKKKGGKTGVKSEFLLLFKTNISPQYIYYSDQSCQGFVAPPLTNYKADVPTTQHLISGSYTYYSTSFVALTDIHVEWLYFNSQTTTINKRDYSAGESLPNISGNNNVQWMMMIWPK